MNVLVCIKRVPDVGAKFVLTADEQDVETRHLGWTIGAHETCAVEEAIRLVEARGGASTVLTLGPDAAEEQLRDALSQGIDEAILLETDGSDWDPIATARAIVAALRARLDQGISFDLLLFGNESADAGHYQLPARVAHALGLPCVYGIKRLEVGDGTAIAQREAAGGGWEVFQIPLPAVLAVKEGLNLPRYPSLRGRMVARRKEIERVKPEWDGGGLKKVRLKTPVEEGRQTVILGEGVEAVPGIVSILRELGVI